MRTVAHEVTPATRPMYWSVRRELWENRSITIAPLAVAALVLFASLVGMVGLPGRMRAVSALDPAKQHAAVVGSLCLAPAPIMLVTFLVGLFYCLSSWFRRAPAEPKPADWPRGMAWGTLCLLYTSPSPRD